MNRLETIIDSFMNRSIMPSDEQIRNRNLEFLNDSILNGLNEQKSYLIKYAIPQYIITSLGIQHFGYNEPFGSMIKKCDEMIIDWIALKYSDL